jgi:hypothetical protein
MADFIAGKYYRTEGGFAVYCVGQDDLGNWVFRRGDKECSHFWGTNDGRPVNREYHIVGEWTEPVTVTRWIVAWVRPDGATDTCTAADKPYVETVAARRIAEGYRVGPIEEITTVVP